MDAMEALEGFKSSGQTKPVKQFKSTPSLKFDKKGGQYVIGVLKGVRALKKGSKAGKSVLSLEYIDGNAQFTIEEDGEYKPVAVKVGDVVGIFAPTALDNYARNIEIGKEVYIRCDGKLKGINANGEAVESYQFDVRAK
jgi:hypothetical protein